LIDTLRNAGVLVIKPCALFPSACGSILIVPGTILVRYKRHAVEVAFPDGRKEYFATSTILTIYCKPEHVCDIAAAIATEFYAETKIVAKRWLDEKVPVPEIKELKHDGLVGKSRYRDVQENRKDINRPAVEAQKRKDEESKRLAREQHARDVAARKLALEDDRKKTAEAKRLAKEQRARDAAAEKQEKKRTKEANALAKDQHAAEVAAAKKGVSREACLLP
jgi:hypothetical protein